MHASVFVCAYVCACVCLWVCITVSVYVCVINSVFESCRVATVPLGDGLWCQSVAAAHNKSFSTGLERHREKELFFFTLPFSYLPSFSLFPPFPQPSLPSFPSSPLLLWCCLLSINLLSCFCHFYLCLPSLSLCMNLFLFCFSESLFHVLNLQLPSTLSFLSVCLAFISIPFYTFFAFPPLSVQPDSNCGISHNHKKQEIKERERRWQCGKRPWVQLSILTEEQKNKTTRTNKQKDLWTWPETHTWPDKSEIAFEKVRRTAENICSLASELREWGQFVSLFDFRVTPFQKAPGHPAPGVMVPEPWETTPSICLWFHCQMDVELCLAHNQCSTDLNSQLTTWNCLHCRIHFSPLEESCSWSLFFSSYVITKQLFV